MPKGSIWSDTFEQLAELGKSTAKHTGKALKQTFSPIELAKKAINIDTKSSDSTNRLENAQTKKQNHTPLDLSKLENQYQNQDKIKADNLRNRLFQLVKSGEEKVMMTKKQEEEEKKRKEAYEDEEKKRRKKQQSMQQPAQMPRGKERKSIFSAKKVAKREQAEVKPASGKQ